MRKPSVSIQLNEEDSAYLDALAAKQMSYRGTVARHLLIDRLNELRANDETEKQERNNQEHGTEHDRRDVG